MHKFYKEAKQLLGLGRCQSNDFDAHIAELSITMIQHMLLSLRFRYDTYESKGLLFEGIKDQITNYKLNERLWGLLVELAHIMMEFIDDIDLMAIFEKIVRDDKAMKKLSGALKLDHAYQDAA